VGQALEGSRGRLTCYLGGVLLVIDLSLFGKVLREFMDLLRR
jgi:hypothetical protein